MARTIRPRRVHWPTAFWERAESSYADCDLVCTDCLGRGSSISREDAWDGITSEEVACATCHGSGLLVPARHLPDDIEEMWAGDEAGAGWLAWMGNTGDGLVWPLPWGWQISKRRFRILQDVYIGGPNVLAYMNCGSVVIGLHELDECSRGWLETVFRLACGEEAEVPTFVMPKRAG